jgi:hypothetical protein
VEVVKLVSQDGKDKRDIAFGLLICKVKSVWLTFAKDIVVGLFMVMLKIDCATFTKEEDTEHIKSTMYCPTCGV